MSVNITKTDTNKYSIVSKNNQIRFVSFLDGNLADDKIMNIIYRETELDEIESKICELEKKLSDSLNNTRLFKTIKAEMNLLIRKYELLEHDLYLIKQEWGLVENIQNNKKNIK